MHLAKLYKWVSLCVKTRKDEVTYRKAQRKKAIGQREQLIQREEERKSRLQVEIAEAETKFAEEHKEEIEQALKWESEQQV